MMGSCVPCVPVTSYYFFCMRHHKASLQYYYNTHDLWWWLGVFLQMAWGCSHHIPSFSVDLLALAKVEPFLWCQATEAASSTCPIIDVDHLYHVYLVYLVYLVYHVYDVIISCVCIDIYMYIYIYVHIYICQKPEMASFRQNRQL